MSEDKSYNGWTNYETWAVKLWMDNDEGTQDYWRERTREYILNPRKNALLPDMDMTRYDLADELKREHEENVPDIGASVYSDLLGAAMSEVNWSEIAESLIDDTKEAMLYNGEEMPE